MHPMQRSDFVIKLISVVLFIAIALYFGLYLYNSARSPFQTAVALTATVEEAGRADGYIVRDESVIPGNSESSVIAVSSGERVRVGQTVATVYRGGTALQTAGEIRELQQMIEQMERISSGDAVSGNIDAVAELSAALRAGKYDDISTLAASTKNSIFSQDAAGAETIGELKARLALLESKSVDASAITVQQAGVFSTVIDGHESVSPADLKSITPAGFASTFSGGTAEPGVGKLISGTQWYYAALMSADDAARLVQGSTATVKFQRTYKASLEMKVERISAAENGQSVVVFSTDRQLEETSVLRELSAEVVFSSVDGLAIPKQAIHLDEAGKTYVFLLTGYQAELVYVDILAETAENYIVNSGGIMGWVVENGEEVYKLVPTSLREGGEIIVKANDLYDGKVVKSS